MSNSTPTDPNINTLWARLIVDEFARCGLRRVCISPGSRSTPLVVAFAAHPDIDDISIIDERSAGFFALGLARAEKRPTALVCTSGTAAAHYMPALCEAFHSELPLLILSADRPRRLQDCGASQAMDQIKLYGDKVRWFHQMGRPEATADNLRYARATACRAFARATGPVAGPVHLNIPFRKPLEPIDVGADHRDRIPETLFREAALAVEGREVGRPFITIERARRRADEAIVESAAEFFENAERPLILAGADHGAQRYSAALCALARRAKIPIIAESTAGLRGLDDDGGVVFGTGDFLFESSLYDNAGRPDLLIRTGRAPISWSIQRRLDTWADVPQLAVSCREELAAPGHLVGRQIIADERTLFETIAAQLPEKPASQWLNCHRGADESASAALERILQNSEGAHSSAHIWHALGESLPDGASLFVSNSMPIRDIDSFMSRCPTGVDVTFNRGLNGIDGVVSTGLAVAKARQEESGNPTVIVVGDVALRHDLSALRLADELSIDATIVVLDNDGGAIFEMLPIADFDGVYEEHFATGGRRRLDDGCVAPLACVQPADCDEFRRALHQSIEEPGTQVVLMRTDRSGDIAFRRRTLSRVADHINAELTEQTQTSTLP